MDDTRLADTLLLGGFRFTHTWGGFLHAGYHLDIAFAIHLKAVDFTGGEVAFDVPVVGTSATHEENVFGELLIGQVFVPEVVDPYNVVAPSVGEAHILAAVEAHMLIDDRAHAPLVDVVAVDVVDTLLDKPFHLGHFTVGWGKASVLLFDGKAHFIVLVESPSMVIVAPHLGYLPCFHGFHILLRTCQGCKHQQRKCQARHFFHIIILCNPVQSYL